jgi:ABC-2 type transport system ATP-binding protein
MSQPLLVIDSVAKSFGETKALQGVSLTVGAGEFVALLGPNGAGKSTLLQLLTGLFTPDSGKIGVLGHDLRKSATRALAGIGVVFQQQTLDLELSVGANLRYHADLHGLPRSVATARIKELAEHFGLDLKARTRVLSGGNRRRVELARALLHRPRVLLMDEATVGLDPNSRRDLLDEMVRLKNEQQLGILWTTHLIDEVERADRLVMLDRGRILYDGTAADLVARSGNGDLSATVLDMMEKDTGPAALTRPAHGVPAL